MTTRNPPRWHIGRWHGLDHYVCTAPGCPFDTLDRGAMVEHARERHPRAWESGVEELQHPLADLNFASDEAAGLAIKYAEDGLTISHFSSTPSGKTGYTVADVRNAAKALTTEEV